MILKNIMEDKQLNFDQPLLSVRRSPSTAMLPDNGRKNTNNSIPSVSSCLPYQRSELKSIPVRDPGTVPFQWEQIPGRPKDENKPQKMALEYPLLAPKLPPGRILNNIQKPSDKVLKDSSATRLQAENDLPSSPHVLSLEKNLMELEKYGEEMEKENRFSGEDNDSTYIDALDTLSRCESFFLNCSVSGVSGWESSDVEPSGTFSDAQTRDFMMDRFLPAAMAMASEMPQFASRKQPSVKEQHRPARMVVTWDVLSPHCYLPPCTHDKMEEVEDDEEHYEETEKFLAKFKVRRVHKRPASTGSCSDNVSKDNRAAIVAQRPATPVHKFDDTTNNLHDEVNKITYLSDSRKSNETYKHGHVVGYGTSPCKNVLPTSSIHEEKGVLGIPEEAKFSRTGKHHSNKKGFKKFQEFLAEENAEEDSDSANPTTEKTLYIDSVQMIESQSLNSSFSSESMGTADSRGRTPSVDHSLQDVKYVCCVDEKALSQSQDLENVDCNVLACLGKSSQEMQKDGIEEFQQNQDLKWDSNALACLTLQDDQKPYVDVQQSTNADSEETTYGSSSQFLLPPALPKSPSESWLSRTLPSISRNPSSKSHLSALWRGNLAARP